jgi:hypothetical protein
LSRAGVVFQVWFRAGESDALAGVLVEQDAVRELRAVVAIQPEDPRGEIKLLPL